VHGVLQALDDLPLPDLQGEEEQVVERRTEEHGRAVRSLSQAVA
jgi:hypothetical protein